MSLDTGVTIGSAALIVLIVLLAILTRNWEP